MTRAAVTETPDRVQSLDEAIEQAKSLGHRAAEEIDTFVLRTYGEDWVREQVADLYLEVLHWRALTLEGNVRRANEREADEAGITRDYLRDPIRVPVYDEKGSLIDFEVLERGAMSADQHMMVAAYRRRLAKPHLRAADRHENDAALIRLHGATCLNEVPLDARRAA